MPEQLPVGALVYTDSEIWTVEKELGTGGQGSVYKVTSGAVSGALKWYNHQSATEQQKEAIEELIQLGTPGESYIWPESVATLKKDVDKGDASERHTPHGFGYLMPLIDGKRFTKLSYYFSGEATFKTEDAKIAACLQIAASFHALHLSGLCYRDLSFANLFVDFETGEIQICDNDNVTFDSLASPKDAWGTSGFIAPEIMRAEAPPSSLTDLYALSVVLFRILFLQHPLQGAREYAIDIADQDSEIRLYGTDPLFIYDPDDDDNRPVKGKKDISDFFWNRYPESIRQLFTEAFTRGLHEPHERIRESVWIEALSVLRAQDYYCESCGGTLYYDLNRLKKGERCEHCGRSLNFVPPRVKIGNRVLTLTHCRTFYVNQIDSSRPLAYEEPFAQVVVHPKYPTVWGLKNLSQEFWRYTASDGTEREIGQGQVLPIKNDLEANMGGTDAVFRIGTK
ncbi:MAG: eukaryotic-like serine/threonine-protein kinase [Clostridiales bacterium]|nr:eukaryotic-like serine/threonine-protein kinase [Clostridiales bacterium]